MPILVRVTEVERFTFTRVDTISYLLLYPNTTETPRDICELDYVLAVVNI